jgi:hypothetical protein
LPIKWAKISRELPSKRLNKGYKVISSSLALIINIVRVTTTLLAVHSVSHASRLLENHEKTASVHIGPWKVLRIQGKKAFERRQDVD